MKLPKIPAVPREDDLVDAATETRTGERAWVKTLEPLIALMMEDVETPRCSARVCSGCRLPYACEILQYKDDSDEPLPPKARSYETDLLIYDLLKDGSGWIPRVVIECKLGSVTTHDALTYSTKAATHKHVHPYLRYGIIIGAYGRRMLPPRLVRHGAYFDFMMVWVEDKVGTDEHATFQSLLLDEIRASRLLQQIITERRGTGSKYQMLHRKLCHNEATK